MTSNSFWAVTADGKARRVRADYAPTQVELIVWAHKTTEAVRKAAVERNRMAVRALERAGRRA